MKLPPVALAFAALFCTFDTERGSAQSAQPYLELLDSYASGQVTQAVEELSAWPEARVRAAVRSLDAQVARDRARTALMLHTEAAFDEPADGRESFQVGIARSFLQRLIEEPADVAAKRTGLSTGRGGRDLSARWHALIGILYCAREDDRRAQLEINRGLTLDSKHKDVNLVAGALVEHRVHREASNLFARDPDLGRFSDTSDTWERRSGRALLAAAERYRGILSNHPDFLEARLRLGWVSHVNNSPERSREQLEEVAARATSADLLYLAHLFLGSVHERANRLSEAAREYEAARGVAPLQSSVIGLIRIEAALEHDDRARALTADIPAVSGSDTVDLWHSYNMCFTGGALLERLRAEAQRQ